LDLQRSRWSGPERENSVIVKPDGNRDKRDRNGLLIAAIGELWSALEVISYGLSGVEGISQALKAVGEVDVKAAVMAAERGLR
jgi:hypothetical protein